MNQHDQDQAEDLNKVAVKTGDYVLTGLVQVIAVAVSSLIGASPLQSAKIAQIIYRNLGLIIGAIVTPFLIIALILMSSQNQEKRKIDISNTEASSLDGVKAKVLSVPYFNQWLEPDGTFAPVFPKRAVGNEAWDLGQVICGAASVTMVAGYYNKLPYNTQDEHDLKKFAYTDQNLQLPSKCDSKEIGGAFGMTAYDSNCGMSSQAGMVSYLGKVGLKTNDVGTITFDKVKTAIDSGHPLIVSMSAPVGHISVIKGYSEDGRLVMNDPYRNVQNGGTAYSYNGKNALYQVNTGWTVSYLMEIYQ